MSDIIAEMGKHVPFRRKSHRIQGPDSDDDDDDVAAPVAQPITTVPAKAQGNREDIVSSSHEKSIPFMSKEDFAFVSLPADAADNVVVLDDPDILAIGSQIKQLEDEIKVMEESNKQDWKNFVGPAAKKKIDALEALLAAVTNRLVSEKDHGEAHIEALGYEMSDIIFMLDEEKRRYYFPNSRTAIGQEGLYLAFDDCRVENVGGRFDVEFVPSMGGDIGQISFGLTGYTAYL